MVPKGKKRHSTQETTKANQARFRPVSDRPAESLPQIRTVRDIGGTRGNGFVDTCSIGGGLLSSSSVAAESSSSFGFDGGGDARKSSSFNFLLSWGNSAG